MNKNGLEERGRERKVSRWVMRVSGFFLISFFLVPLINDEGEIPKLSGRANTMDYATIDGFGSWGNADYQRSDDMGHDQSEHGYFAWTELDPYSAFIYGFGDLNCHNKNERSWIINGNQMPVCTRDVGIFFGAFLGGLLFYRRGYNRWTIRDSFLSVFPDDKIKPLYEHDRRLLAMWALGAIAVIPIGLDGGIQMLTSYESNTISRLLTGAPFGMLITWFFCSSLCSRPAKFSLNATKVILPGNARLQLLPETPDSEEESREEE